MPALEAAAVTTAGTLVAPAVAAAEKSVGNWLKRKYGYVKHINKNWKNLEVAKQAVMDKKSDIETELANHSSSKEKTEECGTWLRRAEQIISEIEAVERDYDNRPSTWLCGLCPYCALHKLGKRIVEQTTKATNLTDDLRLNRIIIMQDKPASSSHSRRSKWNNDERIVDHPSLQKNVATLLEWLKNDELKRICIWGPPGVGKTTIMKTVLSKMREYSCNFDHIFVVTVTTENIQEVIWAGLGKRMDENTNPRQRADEISKELREKKYLLFLDEVSSVVNLEEVGIHSNHSQGKVVFACRDKYAGHTDEDMNVRSLSEEDAGKLFWKIVGSDLEKRGEIKRIAKKIIELCGGMPPIIMLIGKDLEGENDPARWRHVKSQLQSPSSEPWQELEEYYRSFKLVYARIPDVSQKRCLLYWAIFPLGEEINRDYMIDCWIAEQFLEQERLHATRDRGHYVLADFVRKLLVEKGEKLGHFKMFECFQKAAFRIANMQNDQRIFVANGQMMQNEEWRQAKRVSFARVRLSPLPEMPHCSGMLTLFFQENRLTEFPAQFFKFMTDLQVLGFKETGITALPSSISKLKNLQGLFLNNGGQYVHLPRQMGKLQNLKILDVTGIYSLPSEIRQLKSLKCLRVSFKEARNQNHVGEKKKILCFGKCSSNEANEQMIPAGTIKELSNLEELSLDVSLNIRRWNENANEIANEVTMLEHLTHLHFYFADLNSFQYFIENSKSWNADDTTLDFVGFRSFSFSVGQQGDTSASDFNVFECSAEKHLKFLAGDEFPEAVSEVLKQAKSFELIGHTTASNLSNLPADALQELEACIVKECGEMLSIVNGNTNTTGVTDNLPAATLQEPGRSEAQSTLTGNSEAARGVTENLPAATFQDSERSEAQSAMNGNSNATGVTDNLPAATLQGPECNQTQSIGNGNNNATGGVTDNLPAATSQELECSEVQSILNGNTNATGVTDNLPAATFQDPVCSETLSTVNGNSEATGGLTDNLPAATFQDSERSGTQSTGNGNSNATGVTDNLPAATAHGLECSEAQNIVNVNTNVTGVTEELLAAKSQEPECREVQSIVNSNTNATGATDNLPAATFQDPGCSETLSTVNGNSEATGGLTDNLPAATFQDSERSGTQSTGNGNSNATGVTDNLPAATAHGLECSEAQNIVNVNTNVTGVTEELLAAKSQEPECGEVQSIVNSNTNATGATDNLPAATFQDPGCSETLSTVNGNSEATGGLTDNLPAATFQDSECSGAQSTVNDNSNATGVTDNLPAATAHGLECSEAQNIVNVNTNVTAAMDNLPAATSQEPEFGEVLSIVNANANANSIGVTENLRAATLQEPDNSIVPQHDDAMQHNINGNARTTRLVFRLLKKLHIEKLPKLVRLWEGTLTSESFCELKTLTLKECPVITTLFSLEMVRQLPKLQHLQVEDCAGIEKIIDAESAVRSTAFPELKSFQFCSLTSLSSICDASLEWPSLETILIKTCGELKSLPHILGNAPKLREIRCDENWWNQQLWRNRQANEDFRTLRRDLS